MNIYRFLALSLQTFKLRVRISYLCFGRNRKCYLWGILAGFFLLTALSLFDLGAEVTSTSDLSRAIADFADSLDSPATVRVSVTWDNGGDPAGDCEDSGAGGRLGGSNKRPRRNSRSEGSRLQLPHCLSVPLNLVGRFTPDLRSMPPHQIAVNFPEVRDGGHFVPQTCQPSERTAILIPYRNRWGNLHTLLPVLFEMLSRQHVDFTIYVIEQVSNARFNKGLMFNAGFLEAMRLGKYDCIILHDVDMVPIDDRNLYRCNKTSPLHFSSSVDKFNYTTLYSGLFGGVSSFTTDQFRQVNGFSNMYFGWGAEDDDLRDRALFKNLSLFSKPTSIGAYNMIQHGTANNWKKNADRFMIYYKRYDRIDIDGLNSARYRVVTVAFFPIYTWLTIQVNEQEVFMSVPEHLQRDPTYTKDDSDWDVPSIPELPG